MLGAMAKQALGRSLEALLGNRSNGVAGKEAVAPAGPGVRSLLRGQARRAVLPRWYLFGGDILLTVLALVIAYRSPHPLSLGREIFCAAAVALGAALALGAVWNDEVLRAGARIMSHGETPEKF
jgi:hypothetical protein